MPKTHEQHGRQVKAPPGQGVVDRPGRAAAEKAAREIRAAVVRDKGGPFKIETLTLEEPRRAASRPAEYKYQFARVVPDRRAPQVQQSLPFARRDTFGSLAVARRVNFTLCLLSLSLASYLCRGPSAFVCRTYLAR